MVVGSYFHKSDNMNKAIILRSWRLIQDAMNPNNRTMVMFAIDDLFSRIENDKMETIDDFISFKNDWYTQMKNK